MNLLWLKVPLAGLDQILPLRALVEIKSHLIQLSCLAHARPIGNLGNVSPYTYRIRSTASKALGRAEVFFDTFRSFQGIPHGISAFQGGGRGRGITPPQRVETRRVERRGVEDRHPTLDHPSPEG